MIRQFTPSDVQAVFALEQAYARQYPGAVVLPAEVYLSPGFHDGQDVLCAYEGEQLLAYAPLYFQQVDGPPELPHMAWVEIKADPQLADPGPVKDALYECLYERALQQAAEANAASGAGNRPLRMNFEYLPVETAAIAYVLSKGFVYAESTFSMQRALDEPIPDLPAPDGITLRFWRMESEEEQRAYIAARNECFPESPAALGDWQYFMQSPMWAVGGSIAAFDGAELVGNVAVYWNEAENAEAGIQAGYTEYIFVRPGWRGRGVARAMINAGLHHLRERGLKQARLEVRALNENALGLYLGLGYRVTVERHFYTKKV